MCAITSDAGSADLALREVQVRLVRPDEASRLRGSGDHRPEPPLEGRPRRRAVHAGAAGAHSAAQRGRAGPRAPARSRHRLEGADWLGISGQRTALLLNELPKELPPVLGFPLGDIEIT